MGKLNTTPRVADFRYQRNDRKLLEFLDFLPKICYKSGVMSVSLAKKMEFLKNNGFNEQQAHTLVYFYKDSIESELATKKDIEQLRADTKKDIADLKKDIEQLRAATKKDIEQLRADTKKDIEQLRADTKKDIADLKKDIEHLRVDTKKDIKLLENSLTIRLGGIMIAGITVLGSLMALFQYLG